jgi:hypothetical protein
MVWWWWIAPTVVGLIGTGLLISGLLSVFKGRVFSGLLSGAGGAGLMAVGAIAGLLALDVQTYGRLTYERPVATVQTRQLGPQYFEATVMQPGLGESAPGVSNLFPLHGDEWRIEAQVLKWKPWANVLGLDTQYRLDRLSGRYQSVPSRAETPGRGGCHGGSVPGIRRGNTGNMSTRSTPCTAAVPICRWPTGPSMRSGSPSPDWWPVP